MKRGGKECVAHSTGYVYSINDFSNVLREFTKLEITSGLPITSSIFPHSKAFFVSGALSLIFKTCPTVDN